MSRGGEVFEENAEFAEGERQGTRRKAGGGEDRKAGAHAEDRRTGERQKKEEGNMDGQDGQDEGGEAGKAKDER